MSSTSDIGFQDIIGLIIGIFVVLGMLVGVLIAYSNHTRSLNSPREDVENTPCLERGVNRALEENPEGVTEILPSYTPSPAFSGLSRFVPTFMRSQPSMDDPPIIEPPPEYQSTTTSHIPIETQVQLPPPVYQLVR
ncbi:hypothetical protein K7432_013619 [Basidiobolus ranarum]|uniref:Uncharacterized protein n=1 Tax=Basidiobolus ranarum TaxID=34480 RepID=A0ABR2VQQ6_9FUNG